MVKGYRNHAPLEMNLLLVFQSLALQQLHTATDYPRQQSYSPWGREESDTTERLHFHFSLLFTGEGNGNPLQCSSLENPRDVGCRLWGRTEWDTTDVTWQQQQQQSSAELLLHSHRLETSTADGSCG